MTKTDAAAQTLSGINPDVRLESYTMNITTVDGFERFKVGQRYRITPRSLIHNTSLLPCPSIQPLAPSVTWLCHSFLSGEPDGPRRSQPGGPRP